jgi:hypothetical protein
MPEELLQQPPSRFDPALRSFRTGARWIWCLALGLSIPILLGALPLVELPAGLGPFAIPVILGLVMGTSALLAPRACPGTSPLAGSISGMSTLLLGFFALLVLVLPLGDPIFCSDTGHQHSHLLVSLGWPLTFLLGTLLISVSPQQAPWIWPVAGLATVAVGVGVEVALVRSGVPPTCR